MTLFQHHWLHAADNLYFGGETLFSCSVQSQKQKSMFRLKTRLTWNQITISGGKVFLLTFMIKEFWMTGTLSKSRLGILSQDPLWIKGSKLSSGTDMSSDGLLICPGPGCWLVCTLQGCLTALVTEVWLGQPGQRWAKSLQLLGPGASMLQTSGNWKLSSARPRQPAPSTHYAFIIWFRKLQGP